jgi:hypothetical protein
MHVTLSALFWEFFPDKVLLWQPGCTTALITSVAVDSTAETVKVLNQEPPLNVKGHGARPPKMWLVQHYALKGKQCHTPEEKKMPTFHWGSGAAVYTEAAEHNLLHLCEGHCSNPWHW